MSSHVNKHFQLYREHCVQPVYTAVGRQAKRELSTIVFICSSILIFVAYYRRFSIIGVHIICMYSRVNRTNQCVTARVKSVLQLIFDGFIWPMCVNDVLYYGHLVRIRTITRIFLRSNLSDFTVEIRLVFLQVL